MVTSRKGDRPVPDEVIVVDKSKESSIKDKVLAAIINADDGLTQGEIYTVTGLNPRQCRYATQELVATGEITNTRKCRCHHTSIYEEGK